MTGSPAPDVSRVRVHSDEAPASGAWNMAVDAFLLDCAVTTGACSLRWYRWSEATLSLGYFQRPDDPLIEGRFANLPRVRRLSGGGAILHDRELTYCCAIGASHPLAARPAELYGAIHGAIIAVFAEFGIALTKRGETDRTLDAKFLCFQRGDANDLYCGAYKVLGSAQRRRRGAVLQHGSLLLQQSPRAPEFPGIREICGSVPARDALLPKLMDATAQVLGNPHEFGQLTENERLIVTALAIPESLNDAAER